MNFSLLLFFFVFFGFGLAVNVIFTKQFIPVVLGNIDKDKYLERKLTNYKGIKWANENLPKDSYIFNYIGTQEYYLKHKSFYPSYYFQGRYDFSKIDDVNIFYQKLKDDGFTHIISTTNMMVISKSANKVEKNYFNMFNQIVEKHVRLIKMIKSQSQVSRTAGALKLNKTYIYVLK